jgi:cytochrome bd-type quinol oxidase subunit 2
MTRTLIYSGGTLAGTLLLVGLVNDVRLPGQLEDAARLLVIAQATFCVVLMSSLIQQFTRVTFHDSTRKLATPARMHVVVYFGLTLYVAFDMLERIHHDQPVSWRVPHGCVLFILSVISLLKFRARFNPIVKAAVETDATVKVTASDTSKLGPDVDLEEIPK